MLFLAIWNIRTAFNLHYIHSAIDKIVNLLYNIIVSEV